MKRIPFMTLANLGLLTMGVAGLAAADDFTVATRNGAYPAGTAPLTPSATATSSSIPAGPTDILNGAYYRALPATPASGTTPARPYANGPTTGSSGYNFFDVEGKLPGGAPANAKFAGYGLLRFDLTGIKSQLAAHYGATPYAIKNVYVVLTQSNAAFTFGGLVNLAYTPDDTTKFGFSPVYTPASGTTAAKTTFTANFGADTNNDPFKQPDPNAVANGYTGTTPPLTGPVPASQEAVATYAFHRGGDPSDSGFDPYAVGGTAAGTGYLDYVPLYGAVPAGLATSPSPNSNPSGPATPTNPTAPTVETPAATGQGNTDLASHILTSNALTIVLNPGDDNVAASWNGISAYFPTTAAGGVSNTTPNSARYAPYIVVTAMTAVAPATVAGVATQEGVAYPHTGGIALDPITVSYYTPGSVHDATTLVGTQSVTPSATDGSFTFTPAKSGTYDLGFKTVKNLQVVVSSLDTSAGKSGLNLTLPGGDSNGDNSVDSTDFTALIGAFNSDMTIAGSGYDPKADFNYDGSVDSSDFTILIGEFNNVGQ